MKVAGFTVVVKRDLTPFIVAVQEVAGHLFRTHMQVYLLLHKSSSLFC